MTFTRQSACRECGAPLSWARNDAGKWVPIEPEPFAPADVPARDRVLLRNGTTVPSPRAIDPVVVLHFRVCPARVRRLDLLEAMWPAMGSRAARHACIRGAGRRSA